MSDLPMFNAKAVCTKCGSEDIHARWLPADPYRSRHVSENRDEHIARRCRRCGYEWDEAPVDRFGPDGAALAAAPSSLGDARGAEDDGYHPCMRENGRPGEMCGACGTVFGARGESGGSEAPRNEEGAASPATPAEPPQDAAPGAELQPSTSAGHERLRDWGARLRRRREERGLTMGDLARELECTVTHVSEMELGRELPTPRDRARILRLLGSLRDVDPSPGERRVLPEVPRG